MEIRNILHMNPLNANFLRYSLKLHSTSRQEQVTSAQPVCFSNICQLLHGESIAWRRLINLGLPTSLGCPGKLSAIRVPSHQVQGNISIPEHQIKTLSWGKLWMKSWVRPYFQPLWATRRGSLWGQTVTLVLTITILARWAETRAYTPPEEPTTGALMSATDTARDPGGNNKALWQLPTK